MHGRQRGSKQTAQGTGGMCLRGFNVVFIIVVHIIYPLIKAGNPTKTMQWDSKESKRSVGCPVLRRLVWIQVWPEQVGQEEQVIARPA